MPWEPIVIVAALWWAAGMTAANALFRRGHDGWHWFVVCALAGPLSFLLVVDQARFVEPQARAASLQRSDAPTTGTTVVVPLASGCHLDPGDVARLAPVRSVCIVATVAYERADDPWSPAAQPVADALAATAQRFGDFPVEHVVAPGRTAEAVVAWAADRAPAVILTVRDAHQPRELSRLVRLAARHPGLGVVITDPAAAPTLA